MTVNENGIVSSGIHAVGKVQLTNQESGRFQNPYSLRFMVSTQTAPPAVARRGEAVVI